MTKEVQETKGEYPQCPHCKNAMVWSFAFNGCEYACLPCNYGAPMFNGLNKVQRSNKYMDEKRRKWSDDIHAIPNGGRCVSKSKGEPCDVCDNPNYEFKYWKKNLKQS